MGKEFEFRPIEIWPGVETPANERKHAPFGVSWERLTTDLKRELQHLEADRCVVSASFQQKQIGAHGLPKAGERPKAPGVILSFQTRVGYLSYPCDTFTDWLGNLRAISLALTALRAIDRYGVTKRNEQYTGWARLTGPAMSSRDAAALLANLSQYSVKELLASGEACADAYRQAVKKCHPDAVGSNGEVFKQATMARDALFLFHGIKE